LGGSRKVIHSLEARRIQNDDIFKPKIQKLCHSLLGWAFSLLKIRVNEKKNAKKFA
jgi:hypothetical protein